MKTQKKQQVLVTRDLHLDHKRGTVRNSKLYTFRHMKGKGKIRKSRLIKDKIPLTKRKEFFTESALFRRNAGVHVYDTSKETSEIGLLQQNYPN